MNQVALRQIAASSRDLASRQSKPAPSVCRPAQQQTRHLHHAEGMTRVRHCNERFQGTFSRRGSFQ